MSHGDTSGPAFSSRDCCGQCQVSVRKSQPVAGTVPPARTFAQLAPAVLSLTLPRRMWMTPAYQFGSGFMNGNGPSHLPQHSTFVLAIGKRFEENWTISAKGGEHRQHGVFAGYQQYL